MSLRLSLFCFSHFLESGNLVGGALDFRLKG